MQWLQQHIYPPKHQHWSRLSLMSLPAALGPLHFLTASDYNVQHQPQLHRGMWLSQMTIQAPMSAPAELQEQNHPWHQPGRGFDPPWAACDNCSPSRLTDWSLRRKYRAKLLCCILHRVVLCEQKNTTLTRTLATKAWYPETVGCCSLLDFPRK